MKISFSRIKLVANAVMDIAPNPENLNTISDDNFKGTKYKMSVQLARKDFNKLVAILRTSPGFANVRDRRRLVEAALEGV